MKRLSRILVLLAIFFGVSTSQALALTIDSIGVTSVPNGTTTSWYYQGSNPAFSGTADPSAQVSVSINGTAATTTADSSGNWTYTPTTLGATGTYPIVLTSGTDSISFSLDITAASNSTASSLSTTKGGTMSGSVELPDELPVTGGMTQTISLIGAGLIFVIGGMLFYWKVVPSLLIAEESEEE